MLMLMRRLEVKESCLGRELRAEAQLTDEGLQVLVAGGDRAHIGAVAVVGPAAGAAAGAAAAAGPAVAPEAAAGPCAAAAGDPPAVLRTIEFPGHRDLAVCEAWAMRLAAAGYRPVVVSAGIHYDGITKEGIRQVLAASERMLEVLLARLDGDTDDDSII